MYRVSPTELHRFSTSASDETHLYSFDDESVRGSPHREPGRRGGSADRRQVGGVHGDFILSRPDTQHVERAVRERWWWWIGATTTAPRSRAVSMRGSLIRMARHHQYYGTYLRQGEGDPYR